VWKRATRRGWRDRVASSKMIWAPDPGGGPGAARAMATSARCDAESEATRAVGGARVNPGESEAATRVLAPPVDLPQERRRLVAPDANVLRHAQVVDQAEVLVDHRDAGRVDLLPAHRDPDASSVHSNDGVAVAVW